MALLMNDAHIINYAMGALQSVGLAQIYFSHPEYLVVQFLIHAVVLFPDCVTPKGLHVFHFVKVFFGVMGYMYEGAPCHYIMAMADIIHPFVITAYPSP